MSENSKQPLSTEPYKGVRDFYPEEQDIQNYISYVWRKTAESYGFVEYSASILEPAELYKAKSGEEIINEQTYTFLDRGEREVTLRPEMTPTVARMVAAKRRELPFPLRWFSMPNLFRYERPQKGRLREHWQLNCDIFGIESVSAEIEIMQMAYDIMRNFGAQDSDFKIKISSRTLLDKTLKDAGLDDEQSYKMKKLLDKKAKIDDFEERAEEIIGRKYDIVFEADEEINTVIATLRSLGIHNAEFAPEIVRGFDYYTGIVFEIHDTHPENNRSMFGGGRYDDLLSLFGNDKVPAVGFGMGDVTMRDFLASRELLPKYRPTARLYLCNAGVPDAVLLAFAQQLRRDGVNVAVDLTNRKIGDQIKKAVKEKIEFILVYGPDEILSDQVTIKHLDEEKEFKMSKSEIAKFINLDGHVLQ